LKESNNADQQLSFSKMFKESSLVKQEKENQFSNMSSEAWKKWVTEQRQEYSQRVKLAHHIRESESSSVQWITPTGVDIERTPEGMEKRKAYRASIGRKYVEGCLTEQVKNWATPATFDSNNIVRTEEQIQKTRKEKNAGCMNLREQVHYPKMNHSRKEKNPTTWATPTTRDYKDTPGTIAGRDQTLGKQVNGWKPNSQLDQTNNNTNGKPQESSQKNWATPRAGAVDSTRPNKKGGIPLAQQAKMNYPTPSVAGLVEGGVAKNVEMTEKGFKATRENGTTYGAKLRAA
jgi:hypothetical protein